MKKNLPTLLARNSLVTIQRALYMPILENHFACVATSLWIKHGKVKFIGV